MWVVIETDLRLWFFWPFIFSTISLVLQFRVFFYSWKFGHADITHTIFLLHEMLLETIRTQSVECSPKTNAFFGWCLSRLEPLSCLASSLLSLLHNLLLIMKSPCFIQRQCPWYIYGVKQLHSCGLPLRHLMDSCMNFLVFSCPRVYERITSCFCHNPAPQEWCSRDAFVEVGVCSFRLLPQYTVL